MVTGARAAGAPGAAAPEGFCAHADGAPLVARRSRAQAHRHRAKARAFRLGAACGGPPGLAGGGDQLGGGVRDPEYGYEVDGRVLDDKQEEGPCPDGEDDKPEDVSHVMKRANLSKPLWRRTPKEVTHEEYAAFYKFLSNDLEDHLAVKHSHVEAQLAFHVLLFVPRRGPHDMLDSPKKKKSRIKFVQSANSLAEYDEPMPEWLHYFTGVVDSEDLQQTFSHETLHKDKILRVLKKNLVQTGLGLAAELAEQTDDYKKFYEQLGERLRMGAHAESANLTKDVEPLSEDVPETPSKYSHYVRTAPSRQDDERSPKESVDGKAGTKETSEEANFSYVTDDRLRRHLLIPAVVCDAFDRAVAEEMANPTQHTAEQIAIQALERAEQDTSSHQFWSLPHALEAINTLVVETLPSVS